MLLLVGLIIAAYLYGSINMAIIICKLFKVPSPLQHGSKNPGVTNVLRLGGKLPALLTLVLDFTKGTLPLFWGATAGLTIGQQSVLLLTVIVGHAYPIYFGFKGGKGIAPIIGALLYFSPPLGGLFVITWLIMAFALRISSLSALVATAIMPIAATFLHLYTSLPALIITALLIFWRHRGNIQRLYHGTEPKIGQKSQ